MIRGPFDPHTGYGQDLLSMTMAFVEAGADVYVDPTVCQPPLPPVVAELLTKRFTPPFDLYIHHVDPSQLGISPAARKSSSVTVAHSMWEFTTLDNCKLRSSLRRRLKDYDLVVGYDAVSSGALEPYVTTKLATVQGGYWPQKWPARPRDWSGTLNFCMVGALGARKDPFVAIDAFRELRAEHPGLDMTLNLKTVVPGLHSRLQDVVPGLKIFYEVWPEEVLRDFYYSQHILLAPSRGEGKNLPALEMLSTGGTVMASSFGGHLQWLSPEFAYPIDVTLSPLSPDLPNCLWAKASKKHLKELMLHAYHHRSELQRKAELGAEIIPAMCSWPKAIDRLMDRIAELGDHGERVVHKYRVAKERAQMERAVVSLL